MILSDFIPGQRVQYIPHHARGDVKHPDCEFGFVSSLNEKYVFVKYIRNGVLQTTAQATLPNDLRKA